MMVCIGDLHISHKSDRIFEQSRLNALLNHLEMYEGSNYSLSLLGDIFDSNSPSLEDIKMFYYMVEKLNSIFDRIHIICGNHDWKVFEYLPEKGFTYYQHPTTIGDITYLPWTHLENFTTKLVLDTKNKGKILLSHARCTIHPHIVEETNIKVLASRFGNVVLGDIHMPYSPYENVYYTSEPTQHHYKTYSKNTTGYIIINEDYSIKRVFTDLPYKTKLSSCSYSDLDKLLSILNPINRYKIVVEDNITNLQKLKKIKLPHVKFEVIPIIVMQDDKQGEALRDMVSGKISVEQLLFDYVAENYKFDPMIASKIIRKIK